MERTYISFGNSAWRVNHSEQLVVINILSNFITFGLYLYFHLVNNLRLVNVFVLLDVKPCEKEAILFFASRFANILDE